MDKLNDYYYFLVDTGVCEDVLKYATGVHGNNKKTYDDLVFYFYGCRDIDDLMNEQEMCDNA